MVIQEAAGDEVQAKLRLSAISGFPLLEVNDETKDMARALLDGKAVPEECLEDSMPK